MFPSAFNHTPQVQTTINTPIYSDVIPQVNPQPYMFPTPNVVYVPIPQGHPMYHQLMQQQYALAQTSYDGNYYPQSVLQNPYNRQGFPPNYPYHR